MIDFREQELDVLLATDRPGGLDEDFGGYGYAVAAELSLRGHYGRPVLVSQALVLAFHRSDDQSHAPAGGMDLEFELEDKIYEIELSRFVERELLPLRDTLKGTFHSVVVAVCNPDLIDLSDYLSPLAASQPWPLYWPHGEVRSAYEGEELPRVLQCQRWHRLGV